jgi:hypothetical protein
LASGHLKDTNRYKEAKDTLEKAKKKYGVDNATIVGHSLGSSIGNNIASRDKDKVIGLDGGYTIGQKTRANTTDYRSAGDLVSALGANAKHMTTLSNGNIISNHKYALAGGLLGGGVGAFIGAGVDALNSHNVDNIKNKNIFV